MICKIWPFSKCKCCNQEWSLTVFWTEDITDTNGHVHARGKSNTYRLSRISKKTQTHVIGKDMKGRFFEIKSKKPFDYRLQRIQ